MSWAKGDEISASKLNSENAVATWTHSWVDNNDKNVTTTASYKFYIHDCGGTNNPLILRCHWNSSMTKWGWIGNSYGPDYHIYFEKRDASGNSLKRITFCNFENKNSNSTKTYYLNDLKSTFGSAEGWYYLYISHQTDPHGSGKVDAQVYANPPNSKSGYPIRRYIGPTSSGYINNSESEQLLSASNLNTHHFGTYK